MSPDQIAQLKSAPPRVRLWISHWGSGADNFVPVRITLVDGQPMEFYRGGQHEEGYSYSVERYVYDRESGIVSLEFIQDGRDCDGRHSSCVELEWPVNGATRPWEDWSTGEPVERPEFPIAYFDKVDSSQRDYSAEMAGY